MLLRVQLCEHCSELPVGLLLQKGGKELKDGGTKKQSVPRMHGEFLGETASYKRMLYALAAVAVGKMMLCSEDSSTLRCWYIHTVGSWNM